MSTPDFKAQTKRICQSHTGWSVAIEQALRDAYETGRKDGFSKPSNQYEFTLGKRTHGQLTFEEKREEIAAENPEALLADGFEDALIGIVRQFNSSWALYDRAKCIKILMDRDKMTEEDAEEFFNFNTQGAYMGVNTPCFATLL
jgi:hypothetical protein